MRSERSIPEIVSSVAALTPTHAAVLQGDRVLDYGSLNSRANQVAHYLISRGAGAETKVGVSIGRSIEFVIAALGTLKAGAAYVPIDPSYPEARRKLIAGDAGLLLVLSDQAGEPVVSLDAAEIAGQAESDPEVAAYDAEQLAYVIYTSGSTGVPKGVEVTCANLLHLIGWHTEAFTVTANDRSTLLANVGFDAAVWELWPYLSAGSTLLIPELDVIRQPEVLRDLLVKQEVSILYAPTLLAEALIQAKWPSGTKLRALLTGGDTLRMGAGVALPFAIVNNYGPAECTVVSTSGELVGSAGMPSIGRAITGTTVYLLDENLKEVAAGSQGEICIGGTGVARGYLNQPELTAQRFVIRAESEERIYRSGDLGSLNADGSIQFLGRMDEQVKIRGYRIECGEIEAALNSLAVVRNSAVVVREQRDGHVGLTAYLVASEGAALSHEELRQSVRALLPEYMVPEQFVSLSEIPLSDNGKIDRRKLPEPTEANVVTGTEEAASEVESELKGILTGLLGVDRMARDDDFFLLGGHSFIAAQLIARIRDKFGVELGLRAIFEHPTLAGMARQIEERIWRLRSEGSMTGASEAKEQKFNSLYQLLDPEILANPYPLYRALRDRAPVYWDPYLHAWVVTSYEHVQTVLLQFSADRTPTPETLEKYQLEQLTPIAEVMTRQMLFLDPPTHTRLRSLASQAFSVARVERLAARIDEVLKELLDGLEGKETIDVISELAEPLPAIVTAALLGVDVADHNKLKEWSATFAEVLGNFQHNPDRAMRVLASLEEMTAYFKDVIRNNGERDGLIRDLVEARVNGESFSEDEVIANVIVTMVGGQETTTNLIGNGMLTLLRNPEAMAALRANEAMLPVAVEELLRWEPPSQHTARIAPEDRVLGGETMKKGQAVIVVMAAANRDPARFPEPERLDLQRQDNRHLSFGWGSHFCFGAHLARLEGRLAFKAILERYPRMVLKDGPLVWRENLGLRGLRGLPVGIGGV